MSPVSHCKRAALALAALVLPLSLALGADSGRTVRVENADGKLCCTLVVHGEELQRVLGDLCAALEIDLEGLDASTRTVPVTVELRREPVERALACVLGSVGLRGRLRTDALVVSRDPTERATRDELLELAAAAYTEAHDAHPRHPSAGAARIGRGRIEEEREAWNAALEHYTAVSNASVESSVLAEALYRTGLVRERLGAWSEACLAFRQLVSLEGNDAFDADGRRELARCFVRQGDHPAALRALDQLEERHPVQTPRDRLARRLLRADALLGHGEHVECLRVLEELESMGLAPEDLLAVQSLRARAFEGLDMDAEAARAWIVYARSAPGSEHAHAIERAIELALAEGDELGVLFAVSQARTSELRRELARFEREARASLGILALRGSEALSIKEKLDLADEESSSGDPERAMQLLEPLLYERDALPADVRTRLALAWASVQHALSGTEPALAFLRDERMATLDPQTQRALDVLAAALLEQDGRFDDAIRAYEGSYP